MTSYLVSAPPNILFRRLIFDIIGPEFEIGTGGSSGRNLGSGTPGVDGENCEDRPGGVDDGVGVAGGLAWPRGVADGLAWPWRVADGLARVVGEGLGDGEALDGVELVDEVLEHSPLRKEDILEPAIA